MKRWPASAFRLRQVDLKALGDKKVQPLEILVVDTLAELCPEIGWAATPVQGDGGIDFLGHTRPIALQIRGTEICFRYTIIGQVKRSSKYEKKNLDATFGELRRRADKGKTIISQILFVFSTEGNAIASYVRDAPLFAKPVFPGVPVTVMDAADMVRLWAEFDQERFAVVRPAFDEFEFARLRAHLQQLAAERRMPQIRIESTPLTGQRVVGADIDMRLALRIASAYPGLKVAATLRLGPAIDLVRPLAMLRSDARPPLIAIDEHGFASISLRLRPRQAGLLSIGELDLFLAGARESDGPILTHSLGSIEIAPDTTFRHARFLRTANAGAQGALDRLRQSAATRGVEIVALLGPGGIGKSRMIDELFNSLEVESVSSGTPLWTEVHAEHDTQRGTGRRFFRELLIGLAFPHIPPDDPRRADTNAAILEWLRRFVGNASGPIEAGLDAIDGGDGSQGSEAAAFLLLTALIARLRDGPIALHLSNMHWVSSHEADVLAELIRRLSSLHGQLPNGVLLILEGRDGEMIEMRPGSDVATEAWRGLHSGELAQTRIDLRAWPEDESRRFLEELLFVHAGQMLFDRGLERRIVDHVLRYAAGNPMQMIEHIRILVDNGWLRTGPDGSAVFDPPAKMPSSLVDLIVARVEYIRRSPGYEEMVALLKICAEIGLRTDNYLFGTLRNALRDSRLLSALARWDVARIPDQDGRAGEFEFLHESYRDGFRRAAWNEESGEHLRRAVVARLSPVAMQPADRAIAACRLQLLEPSCDLGQMAADLEAVLAGSWDQPQAVIALCRELLDLPRHLFAWRRRFELGCALADRLVWHGDWEDALQILNRTRRELAQVSEEHALETAHLARRAGNLLGDVHRIKEGLAAIREGLGALAQIPAQEQTAEVRHIEELLRNRLGVLLWFSGRLNEGIGHQFWAMRSARRADPGGQRELLFTNEVGMSMTFRYPRRGLALLNRAMSLFERLGPACQPGDDYVRVQRDIARLLLATSTDEIASVRDDLIAFLEGRKPSIYGEALGWLVAGACETLLGVYDVAQRHFGEAIASATRCRNHRLRWKAHLAYAAVATKVEGSAQQSSHARYAGHLLADSLDLVEPGKRDIWARTLRLPLEQARRLCGGDPRLDAVTRDIDRGAAPAWCDHWDTRPSWQSRAGEPFQIIHARAEDIDIFIMG